MKSAGAPASASTSGGGACVRSAGGASLCPHQHANNGLCFLLSKQDADSHMQSREVFLAQVQGNTLTKIDLLSNITEVAFWVDFACVNQDNPLPGIAALPLYGACPVILCHETDGCGDRAAWTRVERVLSLAYSGSSIAMSIWISSQETGGGEGDAHSL